MASDDALPQHLARDNLWRCNCADNQKHTDPNYHDWVCVYSIWYGKQQEERRGSDGEE